MNKQLIKPFTCMVAYCRQNNGIGIKNALPWPMIKGDMKHFMDVTSSKENLHFDNVEQASSSLLFNSKLKA